MVTPNLIYQPLPTVYVSISTNRDVNSIYNKTGRC